MCLSEKDGMKERQGKQADGMKEKTRKASR
jgi:hypothetical protein